MNSGPKMAAKRTSTKKSTVNKSDFIREHPSLSTAEVVAKGKAAGIKFSTQLVYHVRGGSKAKKRAAKKGTTAQPSAAPTKAVRTESKADFVRSRSHLSPREIVEDAKIAGLTLNVRYIYNVRKAAKAATKQKRVVKPTPAAKTTLTNGFRSPASSSAEALLRAVAAEVGLGRAIQLLEAERARVHAILRG
jgi:hypothetical protein